MHLQWFAEEAPESDDAANALTFEEDPDAVDVVVGGAPEPTAPEADPEFGGKTKEELIEIVRAARSGAGRDATAVALTAGLEKLTNQMARPTYVPAPQAPERDPDEVIRESILEKPVEALNLYFAKKVQPDLQRIMGGNLNTSKKFAKLDPETAWVLKDYEHEVEEEVGRMDPMARLNNPDVYAEACNRVKIKHVDAIIERQVAERLQKVAETKPKTSPTGTYSEVGSGRPAPTRKTIRITEEQEFDEKQQANAYGIEWENWIKTTSFQKKYGGSK
jgi:hypothetical protein